MKPAPFEYVAPESEAEVLELLHRHGDDARLLAGGQSLVPMLNLRIVQPAVIVDLGRCAPLAYLNQENGALVCGTMTRQIMAENSPEVRQGCPLLAAALPYLGGKAHRNRGTVGGTLAHADRLAELPAVALALEAEIIEHSAGAERTVAAADFFLADLTTALQEGEMLHAVRFPKATTNERSAFAEVGNRRHGFAVVGVAAVLEVGNDGACTKARLAAMGVGATPVRLMEAEQILEQGSLGEDAVRAAGDAAVRAVDPTDDIHASAAYRRRLTATLVQRSVQEAVGSGGSDGTGRAMA
jgi:carbon-monoxide dehydrogenase medium subunit